MKRTAEEVRATALQEFKDHKITTLFQRSASTGDCGMWRCAKPGTGIMAFTVAIMPGGYIVIAGDIGDNILHVSDQSIDSIISWILGSLNSREYQLSKVQPVCRGAMTKFSSDAAMAQVQDMAENGEEKEAAKIRESWDSGDIEEDEWWRLYSEASPGNDIPDCHEPTPDALWSLECLRLFAQLYTEMMGGVKP